MAEEPEPYDGPFVVLRPDPIGYRVSVDPPIGPDIDRTYREKHDAWGYARDLWIENRLPLLDLTEGNIARLVDPGPSKKSCSN
jgi:hypothetical protein